jgi:hypothetical protein
MQHTWRNGLTPCILPGAHDPLGLLIPGVILASLATGEYSIAAAAWIAPVLLLGVVGVGGVLEAGSLALLQHELGNRTGLRQPAD